uniref:Protein RRP5 homolog n=1 Tax=Oncorhynchus tshawytscha TaxID=74940 RepID=A0A8C8EI06_ONCTS
MASTEEDFPRGGKTKQTTESKAEPVRRHTEVDNLFEVKTRVLSIIKVIYEPYCCFNSNYLKVGTLLLGCVKEVADFEVTINLPSGLLGYLNISNISDSYTKILSDHLDSIFSLHSLFSLGMLVRCVVARLDTAKGGSVSIQLSINPKEVNKGLGTGSLKAGLILSGCVESIEDHGYLVDLGIKGTKAFLPKQAAKDKTNKLKVGQYVTSLLEEVKNDERVVRLSISPMAVAQAVADTAHGWTLTNLLPGLLVKAQIKKVTPRGLILEFLSSFTGLVDFMHLEPEQASTFNEGDSVKACVLYVEPSTRLVGLSLRSHLLQPGGDVDLVATERIGEVAHGCKMTALHHLSGAMLELPDQTVVFVHRNHMKEPMEAFNLNRVMAKPEHTCRIMDFSPMEKLCFASGMCLTQLVLPLSQGMVTSLQSHGMMVKVTDYIRGLVPWTHLSDIILKNPEKKYTVGMPIKCRVLSVDPQEKKLTLTRKRALIDSSLPPFLTYEDARRGRVSHGFIVCVKDFGCIVRFYGEVKGLVPPNELSTEPVVVPENMFYVGQVVKAKVLNCDVEKEKLLLSFKAVAGGDAEGPPKPKFDFEVGKKVEVKVVSKVLTGLEVSILPEETTALLPMMHLSDHVSNCLLLWEGLQEGDIISNIVLPLSLNPACLKTLTKKPTLKSFLEEGGVVAKEFFDITVGMQLIGWVKNIMPYGVFVEFPYGLVGLAPKAAMSDKFVSDTSSHFQLGHTVFAKVTNLDEEKRRFLVSLKVSEVPSTKRDGQARLIRGLQERKEVIEMMVEAGSTHTATVHHADRDFAVISLGDTAQLTVIQTTNHLNETFRFDSEKLTAGKTLTITVTKSSCEELEGLPLVSWELAPPISKRLISVSKGSNGTYRYGDVVKGKVKTVKPTCVLVTLEDGSTGCVHVSEIQEVVCVGTFPTSLLKIGSEVTARVIGGRAGNSHRFLPFSHPNFTYSMPELSLLPRNLKEDADVKPVKTKEKLKRYQVGDDVICFVSKGAKHPEKLFKLGQAVSAKVVTVSSSKPSRFSLSLNGVHKLEKGHVIMGLVQKLDPVLGLLVKLPFSAMGTVAMEDLADKYKPKPLERYSKDQLVRCCIVGEATSNWQLSLRSSRTNPEKASVVKDPEIVSLEDLSEGQIVRGYVRTVNGTAEHVSKKKTKGKGEDSDSGVEVYFREEEEENKCEPAEVEKPVPVQPVRLQVTGGFSWDAALSALKPASAALGGEDSSDGEDGEPQKKSHHVQEVEKREAEKALTKLETELMDPGLRPQTAASFERLLLGSPDSSLLWLQFMAFHLQATQIEQARAVAERALKTISFREEQEKLNVWVALLNLENLYGTEESLQKVFERAVQYCEPMPVYQQLADIYAKCQKTKEAEGLYKTMVKRFRQEKAVWLSYGTFLLQQGQSDVASALLQRAIKSLPNKDNVDLIAKFAQLEFRYGDVERGKAMLDRILTSYPKRTDLWSVFIDLMVKHGSQKEVRAVFDRVIHLSVAVKRIKFFFKRYLEYEKKSGTPESIQAVKDKALEYVESKGTEAAR